MMSVAALWPTCLGRSTEEVKLLLRKKASSMMQEQKDASSEHKPENLQHSQTQFSIKIKILPSNAYGYAKLLLQLYQVGNTSSRKITEDKHLDG